MSIAERLKKARSDAGLTLEELANLTGISKTYLWELENDKEGQNAKRDEEQPQVEADRRYRYNGCVM